MAESFEPAAGAAGYSIEPVLTNRRRQPYDALAAFSEIRLMAHQVKILTQYCKGCELCVAACAKGVLEMSEELTEIGVRPARPKPGAECIGCTLCYQVCPDAAIEIWEVSKP